MKKSFAENKNQFGATAVWFAFWFLTLMYLEGVLHAVVFGSFDVKFLYVAGFSLMFAGVFTLVQSFLPEKKGFPAVVVLLSVLIVLFGSQIIYRFVFGTLYAVSQVQQGGQAITSFWKETWDTIKERSGYLMLILVPMAVLVIAKVKNKLCAKPSGWLCRSVIAVVSAVACVACVLCLKLGGTGYFTDYYYYHSNETTTNQAAERFGLLTAMRLELIGTGSNATVEEESYFDYQMDSPAGEESETVNQEEEISEESGYNILNIDFAALSAATEDETLKALDAYCASLAGTSKNEYTGMLKDYNLIVICAESFSPAAIKQEYTPTLYKLANEGIIFNNFYTTFPNNTTNGEYSIVMGLYPDDTRIKTAPSFYASKDSYLPYTLGNIFYEQAGVQSYGYHNYVGTFYGRNETHPNLGYKMKFADDGMEFTTEWPASDLEMMEQSVGDYISSDTQFHAYYMTFSGHYKYHKSLNPMADRNWDAVETLTYSHIPKAYVACHVELDKAMAYLLERLEEAGVADKTAIVIAPDHHPYGLDDANYTEALGQSFDRFSKYHSSLVFWVGGLEENIEVDEYCSNVDILPTILNLWGFEYDSRMLAGTDVFSDGTHVAVLNDKSFYTDKVWFNATSGRYKYLVDESELPENYMENMIKLVNTKFTVSVDILNSAYYNHVFGKESVTVSKDGWTTWDEWKQMTKN